jgi:5,10-methylenetetrahydrofolate reductase
VKEMIGTLVGTQLVLLPQQHFHAYVAFHPEVSHEKQIHWFHSHIAALSSLQQAFSCSQKGCSFESVEEIQEKLPEQLTQISSELCMECWGKMEMSQKLY